MQPLRTRALSHGEQDGHYRPWKMAMIEVVEVVVAETVAAEVGIVGSTPVEEDIAVVGAADSRVVEEVSGSNSVVVVEALIAWQQIDSMPGLRVQYDHCEYVSRYRGQREGPEQGV